MSRVNETRILVKHDLCKRKLYLVEVGVIQSENGIMMNTGMSVKGQMMGVVAEMNTGESQRSVILSAIRHVKLINIQILKNC